jgi:hypothetical protein
MKSILTIGLGVLIIGSFFVVTPDVTLAQDGGLVPCGGPGQNQCQLRDIFVLLHNILEFAIFQLAPILVTAMVALGGFFILTSAGSPGRYAKGLDYIKFSLIGYGIVLVSMLLVNTLLQQLGVATWTGLLNWEIIAF